MVVVEVPDPDTGYTRVVRFEQATDFKIESGCLIIIADRRFPTGRGGYERIASNSHVYAQGYWTSAAVK